jgi:mRNA interferase RelE/StbE
MRSWDIKLSADTHFALAKLTKSVRELVLDRIVWLAEYFDSIAPIPLHAEWRGFYKFRAGDYRIVYQINYAARTLLVEYIDHRSTVYKKKR